MLRVAICDDNKVTLDYLSNRICSLLNSYSLEHTMSLFSNGISFLEVHKDKAFDVVFLDIAMPGMDGFQVAEQIRRYNNKTYIIFITTEESLVYDSFDFQPFYFIPKNNNEVFKIKLDSAISKLADSIRDSQPVCFLLPYNGKKYVHPADIVYIMSKSNYLDIVCQQETIRVRGKIDSLLKSLPGKFFVRIHNRYIVNLKHLRKIDQTGFNALLDNGIELDISRTYKNDLNERYNIYLRDFT